MRNACIGACLALMALAPVASGAAGEKLPDGSVIAGVAVGGLGPNAARAEVRRQLEPVLESPLDIRVRARRYSVPTGKLGLVVLYADMVTAAYAQAHRGEQVDVPLMRTIDRTRMRAAVSGLAPRFYRPSRSARVQLGIRRVKIIHGRTGRALDVGELRRKVLVELRSPTARRRVWGHVRWLRPAVRVRDLRRLYPTYVSVSRRGRIVRLFKHLHLVRRYHVAVGAAGYDTPAGLHHVLSKQVNPTWYVPNRPWAGSLAGKTIPPGDPRNPLKARFIALGGGVGFHGTADLASIGQAASHGCIRMRIPDVISLFNRVSIGTPVMIR